MRKLNRIFWISFYRILFKIKKIEFSESLRICNHLPITLGEKTVFKVGKNFTFSSGAYNPLSRNIKGEIYLENSANLIIGDDVGISSSCIWVFDFLKIGNRVKIGADTIVLDSDTHSLDYKIRQNGKLDRKYAKKKGITIEDDVLIGTRSIILKGVTIGARSIVGSGSIVTKSIPSDEIWAGNPAKFIKRIS